MSSMDLNILVQQLNASEDVLVKIEDASVRALLQFFKNALEQVLAENQQLREENQRLRDEVSRLQGEQGKPSIRPQSKIGDISSEKNRASPSKARKKK